MMRLEDQFEWDIRDPLNSPEQFAEHYCVDLGLPGEFKTAIAHSIREQAQVYDKSLYLVGHTYDGTKIQDEDLRLAFLPALAKSVRPISEVPQYTPLLNQLPVDWEKQQDKGPRGKRRQLRGRRAGAVPLPDRDPLKTARTPAGIGFPEIEKEKELAAVPSRRAAALQADRANAQIAVIESSEQDPAMRQPGFMGGPSTPMNTFQSKATTPMPNNASSSKQASASDASQKKNRIALLAGPGVANRVLKSRPPRSSTALDTAIPPWLARIVQEDEAKKAKLKKDNDKEALLESASKKKAREGMFWERELPEGLHPYMINGVWHCSSCGVPEDIAVGRRQGPLGAKTMCGDCGKWWHRHRKPVENIEYRTDRDYHVDKKKREEEYRRLKKRGGIKAVQAFQERERAQALLKAKRAAAASTPSEIPSASTPVRPAHNLSSKTPNTSHAVKTPSRQRQASPDSSLSPPPLSATLPSKRAQARESAPSTVERRHAHTGSASALPRPTTPTPAPSRYSQPIAAPTTPYPQQPVSPPTIPGALSPPGQPPVRPAYLSEELTRFRAKYPDDMFDVIVKPRHGGAPPTAEPEWRVRCFDCPGKLYNPGPGETLNNFEIHLVKNRQHRAKVAERLGYPLPTPTSATPAGMPTPATPATPLHFAATSLSPSAQAANQLPQQSLSPRLSASVDGGAGDMQDD